MVRLAHGPDSGEWDKHGADARDRSITILPLAPAILGGRQSAKESHEDSYDNLRREFSHRLYAD